MESTIVPGEGGLGVMESEQEQIIEDTSSDLSGNVQPSLTCFDSVNGLTLWLQSHMLYLADKGGVQQAEYVYNTVLRHLHSYSENVERNLNARHHQNTWTHRDTLFLP